MSRPHSRSRMRCSPSTAVNVGGFNSSMGWMIILSRWKPGHALAAREQALRLVKASAITRFILIHKRRCFSTCFRHIYAVQGRDSEGCGRAKDGLAVEG